MPILFRCRGSVPILLTTLLLAGSLVRAEPKRVASSRELPIEQAPIDYWGSDSQNPIAHLARRIESKELTLDYAERFGYLPAVLKELEIPVSSQILRAQSGGLDRESITPQQPRATYFNDDVIIAWHPGAHRLEIAVQDSQKGLLFYVMTGSSATPPRFERSPQTACLACHRNPEFHIAAPGHALRSFLPDDESQAYPLGHLETHNLPVELRWHSRYVTGTAPGQKHRGNDVWDKDRMASRPVANLRDEVDVNRYPAATSDAVANLVFDHQKYGQNLLSRLSYEHQSNVRSKIEEMTVRYLLLVDEAPLDHPTTRDSDYARWYQSRGPKDSQGRSLYDLDLATRLYRHRISPLIQSKMVQGFPPELRQALFRQLNDVLSGKLQPKGYSVPESDRQATLALLRATIADWPSE